MTKFPDNRHFAFTIVDDTDLSTVENTAPIYWLLRDLGIRTTKSVWPLASDESARPGGASLQDPRYLAFILELKDLGFEIALHNVRNTGSTRQDVALGLEEFRRLIGNYPRVHTNHSYNRENVYWGAARFARISHLYRGLTKFRRQLFEGHVPDSRYFWGDMCQQHIDYVRNFTFREVNLDRINPSMPYHDDQRPFVNMWFSSSDAPDRDSFCELLKEANQDRLEEERGICIIYTHLACGFVNDGVVHPRVERLIRRLVAKPGWFVPVSTLLDFLRQQRKTGAISRSEMIRMESYWLFERLLNATAAAAHKLHSPG